MDRGSIGIIGAGPVGIELALQASKRGYKVCIFEAGNTIASNMMKWSHVRLFSPWKMNVSDEGIKIVNGKQMSLDGEEFPLASEYITKYLQPIVDHLTNSGNVEIYTSTKVLHVGRGSILKSEDIGGKAQRSKSQFRLLVERNGEEEEEVFFVDKVVDTSGTFGNHNYFGPGGTPAIGETKLASETYYHIPDVHKESNTFAGKKTIVIGSGHSAITTVSLLLELQEKFKETTIVWMTRHGADPYTRIADDVLPERDRLNQLGNTLSRGTTNSSVTYVGSVSSIDRITKDPSGKFTLHYIESDGHTQRCTVTGDNLVACVGYKPDVSIFRELQVHQCYASEGPMKLAAALLSSSGNADCLAQTSQASDTLVNPEPNFFIIGAKSYGRGSKFLIRIGLDQVKQILDR